MYAYNIYIDVYIGWTLVMSLIYEDYELLSRNINWISRESACMRDCFANKFLFHPFTSTWASTLSSGILVLFGQVFYLYFIFFNIYILCLAFYQLPTCGLLRQDRRPWGRYSRVYACTHCTHCTGSTVYLFLWYCSSPMYKLLLKPASKK